MAVKLNNADNYEPLAPFKLTKEQFPIAWNAKVEEIMEECNMTREDAEDVVKDITFELELYYEKGAGLFAVESEAVECGTIISPYTGEISEDAEEDYTMKEYIMSYSQADNGWLAVKANSHEDAVEKFENGEYYIKDNDCE